MQRKLDAYNVELFQKAVDVVILPPTPSHELLGHSNTKETQTEGQP
jgi:hypothetical protein